ncbi:hypothetical protein HMI54_002464 [Coelomomyces lativittatus]|nr:hypothetical protein HMI54_002464 [Coelomomyces lativittatus]
MLLSDKDLFTFPFFCLFCFASLSSFIAEVEITKRPWGNLKINDIHIDLTSKEWVDINLTSSYLHFDCEKILTQNISNDDLLIARGYLLPRKIAFTNEIQEFFLFFLDSNTPSVFNVALNHVSFLNVHEPQDLHPRKFIMVLQNFKTKLQGSELCHSLLLKFFVQPSFKENTHELNPHSTMNPFQDVSGSYHHLVYPVFKLQHIPQKGLPKGLVVDLNLQTHFILPKTILPEASQFIATHSEIELSQHSTSKINCASDSEPVVVAQNMLMKKISISGIQHALRKKKQSVPCVPGNFKVYENHTLIYEMTPHPLFENEIRCDGTLTFTKSSAGMIRFHAFSCFNSGCKHVQSRFTSEVVHLLLSNFSFQEGEVLTTITCFSREKIIQWCQMGKLIFEGLITKLTKNAISESAWLNDTAKDYVNKRSYGRFTLLYFTFRFLECKSY